jgi:hypothetical protein
MAQELLLSRHGNALVGMEPSSSDAIQAMKHGEVVTATIRRTRNPAHHRKFMALMQVVFDAQTRYPTLMQLLDVIKIATGHFDEFEYRGMRVVKPRSISFAKLDQAAFEQFYQRAVEVIITEVIPGADSTELEARVMDILNNQTQEPDA